MAARFDFGCWPAAHNHFPDVVRQVQQFADSRAPRDIPVSRNIPGTPTPFRKNKIKPSSRESIPDFEQLLRSVAFFGPLAIVGRFKRTSPLCHDGSSGAETKLYGLNTHV